MQQNITLKLDKKLLQSVKMIAVQEKKSISRLMTETLDHLVSYSQKYKAAQKKALAHLDKGIHGGGGPYTSSREELYQRG